VVEIKVLGPGCSKCHQTEKVVMEAIAEAGMSVEVEKVTDLMRIAGFGVFGTPAVVVNGEVKSIGKIPKKDEIKKWLDATDVQMVKEDVKNLFGSAA
jgi:small redox-active disulfide protein 2